MALFSLCTKDDFSTDKMTPSPCARAHPAGGVSGPSPDRGSQAAESNLGKGHRRRELGDRPRRLADKRRTRVLSRIRVDSRTRSKALWNCRKSTSLLLAADGSSFSPTTCHQQIPFTCLQFPLYERLKLFLARRRTPTGLVADLPALEAAACGSLAGGVAAGLTTPLDVAKTRIMLSNKVQSFSFFSSSSSKRPPSPRTDCG